MTEMGWICSFLYQWVPWALRKNIHIYVYIHVYIYTYICMYVYICICMYVYICIYTYMCIYVYINIYINIDLAKYDYNTLSLIILVSILVSTP